MEGMFKLLEVASQESLGSSNFAHLKSHSFKESLKVWKKAT